ncbi:Gfo/Idh/MocA family protein [Flavobacterium urumqiense]|uniref:Oxidoreductase family, NAD-binding Rossmann fold n=1 Tax=Flavobacterium urumqiense TaxID=935224 RepID=A0A1H5Y357_9FLAO|nr:Gfo/Idh/MocA family oxidoreductase [Flavobacterium urumqiense]SEG17986.1 Oxidoreductase family, NAD-binding Rossmann fold [Flavobacterium urumqiense]
MYKVLILGCGNIGALYDFDNDEILTHAKAFNQYKVDLYLFDIDENLVRKVANKYKAKVVPVIDNINFGDFDIISICTPTFTHKKYLEKALLNNVKVIICEKPISTDSDEIDHLINAYEKSNSKVIVNYFRRFQPAYLSLRNSIEEILKQEELTNISIRTQRGFINNSSHAFDLIQYLFNKPLELKNILVHNREKDHFDTDPTLSLQALWDEVNLSLQGLSNVYFSFFEIDVFFTHQRISIQNAGKDIFYYQSEDSFQFLKPLFKVESLNKTDCIKDYMQHVIEYSISLINESSNLEDNFLEAVKLNKSMLTILNNR